MSKSRVIVLSVVHQGLSKAEAARRYNVSWQWVHTLVTRYHSGGLEAVDDVGDQPGLARPGVVPLGERGHEAQLGQLAAQPGSARTFSR